MDSRFFSSKFFRKSLVLSKRVCYNPKKLIESFLKGKSSEEPVKKVWTYLGVWIHPFVPAVFLLVGKRNYRQL